MESKKGQITMSQILRWLNRLILAAGLLITLFIVIHWTLASGALKRPVSSGAVVAKGNPTIIVWLTDYRGGSAKLNSFALGGASPNRTSVSLPKSLLDTSNLGLLVTPDQKWEVSVDGELRKVALEAEAQRPDEVSPSGNCRLLGRSVRWDHVYYTGVQCSAAKRVDFPCEVFSPSWSPDSSRLAVVVGPCDSDQPPLDRGVYLVDCYSGEMRKVHISGLYGDIRSAKYDLTGKFLLVEAQLAPKTFPSGLWVYRLDDSHSWLIDKNVARWCWDVLRDPPSPDRADVADQ